MPANRHGGEAERRGAFLVGATDVGDEIFKNTPTISFSDLVARCGHNHRLAFFNGRQ